MGKISDSESSVSHKSTTEGKESIYVSSFSLSSLFHCLYCSTFYVFMHTATEHIQLSEHLQEIHRAIFHNHFSIRVSYQLPSDHTFIITRKQKKKRKHVKINTILALVIHILYVRQGQEMYSAIDIKMITHLIFNIETYLIDCTFFPL